MYAICIEASHTKGMGHLYRALVLLDALKKLSQPFLIICNDDLTTIKILVEHGINFEIARLEDWSSNWEASLVSKHSIRVWINDRLDTDYRHAINVKNTEARLVTFDDRGSGANRADLNISALAFDESEELPGNVVVRGTKYLILNKEIDKYKRRRKDGNRLIVSFGGSDTHGATIKTVKMLAEKNRTATVILGPAFAHQKQLSEYKTGAIYIKTHVPSLIEEFDKYDMAITSGGLTAFEACASGLPTIVIANETHEISNANYLEKIGCARYAGMHTGINKDILMCDLDIERMSMSGMTQLNTQGINNVMECILAL